MVSLIKVSLEIVLWHNELLITVNCIPARFVIKSEIIPQILISGLIWREIAQVCPRVAQVASLRLFPHICRLQEGMSGVRPISHLCAIAQGRIEHDVLILLRLENLRR